MKLLFDQNLSRKLPARLADLYPDSTQAIAVGLDRAPDNEIRAYAERHGFIIVTRDSDFAELDALYGAPPKTIRIARPNLSTVDYEHASFPARTDRSIRVRSFANFTRD